MDERENALTQLKEDLEKARTLRYRAEAKLEELERQQEDLLREMETLGVTPDQLEQVIHDLEQEIDKLLEEARTLIPHTLIHQKQGDLQ
jgi:chromosome segregation ATPase